MTLNPMRKTARVRRKADLRGLDHAILRSALLGGVRFAYLLGRIEKLGIRRDLGPERGYRVHALLGLSLKHLKQFCCCTA